MRRRPLTLVVGAAVAAVLLAGCTSAATPGPTGNKGGGEPGISDLRAKAAISDCAPPEPAAAAGGNHGGGRLLPDIELPCLAGGANLKLRQLGGVPTVVNLWATWCTPCRKELPAFQEAFEKSDPRALRVLGVVTEDPGLSRPLSFAADTGLHLPSAVDDRGDLKRELGLRGLPATVFVDGSGAIVHIYSGPPLTYETLRGLVTQHLQVRLAD